MKQWLSFARRFASRPRTVGAIAPSSRFLARAMLEDAGVSQANCVAELGPGTGAFTAEILPRLGEQTTFFALEIDPEFAGALRDKFPRLTVYNASAERLPDYAAQHGHDHVDTVLSGLPWASLPLEVQDGVLEAITNTLRPGGHFATFAYIHAKNLPNARIFRDRLRSHFSKLEVSPVVWRNLPPAFVYRCKK